MKKIYIFGILFLILLAVNVTAFSVTQAHSDLADVGANVENVFRGHLFTPQYTGRITNITSYPLVDEGACTNMSVCVYEAEGYDNSIDFSWDLQTNLGCTSWSNATKFGNFSNVQIIVNITKQYMALIGEESGCLYDQDQDSSSGFPEATTYIYWNKSGYKESGGNGWREISGVSYSILSIGIENESLAPPAASLNAINLSILSPLNGTEYGVDALEANNSIINFTFSVEDEGIESFGLNDSRFTLQSNTSSVYVFHNNTPLNTTLFYHVYAWANKTGTLNVTNLTIFSVDPVYPTITTSLTNATIIYNGNLTSVFTLEDDYSLWSYNFSINGKTLYNKSNIVQDSLTFNFSYYVGNLTAGNHTLTTTLADGHTKNKIDEYGVDKGAFNNKIRYTFDNGEWVDIRAGVMDVWDTKKEIDRYTFDFMPFITTLNQYEFTVYSSTDIEIIEAPNTPWEQWLIIDGHWLDFVMPEEAGATVEFTKVKKGEMKVKVKNINNGQKIKFSSIGDLNIITEHYNFAVINITTTNEEQVLEGSMMNLTLNVSNGGSGVTSNVTLLYNGVIQTGITKTTGATSEYYFKRLQQDTLTGLTSNYTFNWSVDYDSSNVKLNGSGDVNKIIVGACNTTLNETGINFTVTDANTDAVVIDFSYESSFTIWDRLNPATTPFKRTYGLDVLTKNVSQEICIYPHYAEYLFDSDSLFSHLSYDDTHYITASANMSSSTKVISIKMVNSSLATGVTINLVDENGEVLSGYIIEAYRYNIGTDDYTLITTQYSDSNGQAIFYLDVTTYEYRFIVKNVDGDTVHTEPKQKLYSTSYTFKVTIGSTPEVILDQLLNLDITLTPNRVTKKFDLNWTGISFAASQINLTIYKGNTTSPDNFVDNQISTDDSGTLSYTITDETENMSMTYTAKVFVTSVKDGNEYFITYDTIDFKKAWDVFGTEALVMAFLFIGTMTFIGAVVSPVLGILLTVIGMVFTWWLGFYIVSLSGLMSIIIMLIVIMARLRQ